MTRLHHHHRRRSGGWLRLLLALVAAAAPLAASHAATLAERAYLTRDEIEATLIGRNVVSHNLASGALSRWEFHRDGSVLAVRLGGPGSASGTWTIRADGQMCVRMLARTGCRYWYRDGNAMANADSNAPDAPAVAEVRFE